MNDAGRNRNFSQVMNAPAQTHSKLIGYVLWIFGFTGSHRFYYGKPVSGTIWFFTVGLLLHIGWLGFRPCILANCRIRVVALLAGSAPHAWQIQKNSTTSTRRSPNSRRLMRLCSRRSFLASCLWVRRAFWRSFTRASRTRSLCWEWIVLFTPACCEQIVVASKMRAGLF